MNERNVILCAGMKRSGSTWLYNVLRILLQEYAKQQVYGAWVADYDAHHSAPIHIIKVHGFNNQLLNYSDLVFTSRRDIRDVIASLIKKEWIELSQATNAASDIIETHSKWVEHSFYEVVYEKMNLDKAKEISKLAGFLNVDIEDDNANTIMKELDGLKNNSNDLYDKHSLLHHSHVQDGRVGYYYEVLGTEISTEITEAHRDWLKRYSYI